MNSVFCEKCIYKKVWDCKNCFVNKYDNSKDKKNLLITIIMTRQCNFRCNYCTIDFTNDSISKDTIDVFLKVLYKDRDLINTLSIEFFGGEPTIEFDNMKYIVENTRNLGIRYTTYTNGHLLNEEMIDFFNENNFGEVVFSVSSHNMNNLSRREKLFKNKDLSKFVVNLILEPNNLNNIFIAFTKLVSFGFKRFSLIPVHHSKKWSEEQLLLLNNFMKKLTLFYKKLRDLGFKLEINNFNTNFDKNGKVKEDIELLLDFDGTIYADSETELRLLKDFVSKSTFDINEINMGNISNEDFSLNNILKDRHKYGDIFIKNLFKINDYLDAKADLLGTGNILNSYKF